MNKAVTVERAVMSIPEMAKKLGVSRSLGYALVKNGQIPVLRLGIKRLVVPTHVIDKLLQGAAIRCAK
jgi:excisionase family DNA binding protein